jgi:hypothetical protein
MATSKGKNTRDEGLSGGASAANAYWKRVTDANNGLKNALYGSDGNGGLLGKNGEYAQSITEYKTSVNNALNDYKNGMDEAINKYSGENATKAINKLASEQAGSAAAKAGAESVGAMRSTGMSPAAAAALANSNTINAYNQGLGQQQ